MSESTPEPTVIKLDNNNSCQILTQFIEVAQQKGAFELSEANVLKRASDFLLKDTEDPELNQVNSRQLLIQGVNKGQRHGAYTLNDAALLHKVVNFVSKTVDSIVETMRASQQQPQLQVQETSQVQKQVKPAQQKAQDDLSDLAEPIPLRPKQI